MISRQKERSFRGVEHMNGNANHLKVYADRGCYFLSYETVIAFIPWDGTPELDQDKWNYSKTTSKFRSIFLNETTKETENKIRSGAYILSDLNN